MTSELDAYKAAYRRAMIALDAIAMHFDDQTGYIEHREGSRACADALVNFAVGEHYEIARDMKALGYDS